LFIDKNMLFYDILTVKKFQLIVSKFQ